MRTRRMFALVAMVVALLLTVSSCSRPEGGGGGAEDGDAKVLEVGATGEPAGMDMIKVDGAGTPFVLLYNVYETLVKLDVDKQPQPLLATEWQVSEDRLTYTFGIDANAKFSDGTPVDAAAVVHSFQRILDGDAKDAVLADFAPLESAEAVDDHTVELHLSRPSNHFLLALSSTGGIIVNPNADVASLNETPAGSGPYVLGAWEPGSHVTLERNQEYWGTPSHFDTVNFRYYADPNAMNTAMLSGQLDIVSNLTVPQSIEQFEDPERYTVLLGKSDGEVVLTYNHDNEALGKKEVRQALNHAIDRQKVLDAAWAGQGELIGSMVPPTDPWYEDLTDIASFDPELSKQLLADAGHESGLKLRLRVPNLPYAPPAARSIQSQLRDVGVEVEVEELDFARWLDLVYVQGDFDMTIVAHVEPRDLNLYAREGNYANYSNPEFDELLAQADAGSDEEFVSKQQEAARMIAEDAVADWLFLLPNIIITKPDITGVQEDQTSLAFDVTAIASSR